MVLPFTLNRTRPSFTLVSFSVIFTVIFIVSPGFDEEVVKYCLDNNIPVTPGVCTPSDVQKGYKMGLDVLKFFPDTSLNDLTSAIDRYKKNDTWPTTTTFTKESFDHLQNILIEAGFLDKKVEYDKLIYIK